MKVKHDVVNWGILGTSPISKVIANAIQESKHCKLVAVAGRTLEKARDFANEFAIDHFFNNYHDLITSQEVDAVYIGLPNQLHKEWIIHAAKAGKHVLCEKPMFLNVKEANEVIDIIHQQKIICMEALMYRYHPLTQKIKSLIQNNAIGEIKLINAVYNASIADVANPISGGAIRNLGCYPISLIRFLVGSEPIQINSICRMNPKTNTDNQSSIILKFTNDLQATVSTADDLDMRWEFTVYGTLGTLKMLTNPWLPNVNNKFLIETKSDTQEINIAAKNSLYVYQFDSMFNEIRQSNLSDHEKITLEDSLGNAAVLEQCLNF